MEGFVKFALEASSELLKLLDLSLFKGFHVSFRALG